jgi:hypothetical protein
LLKFETEYQRFFVKVPPRCLTPHVCLLPAAGFLATAIVYVYSMLIF